MKYLQFIWADGQPSSEDIEVMNRDLPGYEAEMNRRGVRLLGRELDLPGTAATLRVRDGETLVSDGPFAETKEFIAGFDVLECADLDEAIEVVSTCPISRFHPTEIRPLIDRLELSEATSAFGRGEDGNSSAFLLMTWMSATSPESVNEPVLAEEIRAWRSDLTAQGSFLFGSALGGVEAATTLRVQGEEALLSSGSFSRIEGFVSTVEVVSCADRTYAITLAAEHPLARHYAIEVRPFYSEAAHAQGQIEC